jgi:hypothetical protein
MRPFVTRAAAVTSLTLAAGCAGAHIDSPLSQTDETPALTFSTRVNAFAAARPSAFYVHPDRSASWVLPAAKTQMLLYISDVGTNDVYIFTFPQLKLSGTLKGFSEPQGECADSKGNVWIANTAKKTIVEYAHAGTKQIKSVSDPGGYPLSCATDSAGDLAVTNIYDISGPGAVLVYKGAGGKPKMYSNPSQYYYYFDGYDPKGNLYVSGRDSSGNYILSVLPTGSGTMSTVGLSGGTIYFPGAVQWVGKSLALGDQTCGNATVSCLYEAHVSGSAATITATTPLTGTCDVIQTAVLGSALAGGDFDYCNSSSSSVDTWAYPKGGNQTKSTGGVQVPVGSAISK